MLSVSGIAYLLRIRHTSAYKSSSVLPAEEVIRTFDMHSYGPITSASALPSGCFVVGRSDGSVGCFQLSMLDLDAPGTTYTCCFIFIYLYIYFLFFFVSCSCRFMTMPAQWWKDFGLDSIIFFSNVMFNFVH